MASETIVVTGATGNIGKKISEALLAKGKKIRAVARHREKLQALVDKGAEAVAASLDDTAAMTKAFQGSKAAFVMIPPSYTAPDFRGYQNHISESLVKAVQGSGIRYIVNLSSLGAHRPDGLGPINGLHDHEQRLNKLMGVNVLHLRPTYFMENQLNSIGVIKQMGINGSALRGDVAIPMIATADIAEAATKALLELDFKDKTVRELLGPSDISLDQATKLIGKAIGKPDLKYVQFSYEDTRKALQGMGFSADVARQFNEMAKGFNEGLMTSTQGRSNKTSTPTSFEDFSKIFAAVYSA
jgi:uncharacterized protein YbjT (DUF2867 family)